MALQAAERSPCHASSYTYLTSCRHTHDPWSMMPWSFCRTENGYLDCSPDTIMHSSTHLYAKYMHPNRLSIVLCGHSKECQCKPLTKVLCWCFLCSSSSLINSALGYVMGLTGSPCSNSGVQRYRNVRGCEVIYFHVVVSFRSSHIAYLSCVWREQIGSVFEAWYGAVAQPSYYRH